MLIESNPDLEVFTTVGSADEALRALDHDVPDLILLDISLPGTSGVDLLKDLRIRYSSLRVLVLSMHEESVYAERVLRAGANGYIMKHEPGDKVIAAIRCVLANELYVSPAIARRLLNQFTSNPKKPETGAALDMLSDRELQVYTQIGHGMSIQAIAVQLHLGVKTIRTYRVHIIHKLGLCTIADLVHHATRWVEA